MDRRYFINCMAGGLAAGALTPLFMVGCANNNANKGARPNILLMMADDMGYSDIGCYGGEINTPNVNKLADDGLRFTQFYNTARCCPTRAALMTGLYPHQAGFGHMTEDRGYDGYRGELNNECVTIAEVLKGSGYSTYMSGKWHVTSQVGQWTNEEDMTSKHNWPRQRGFDRFYGTIAGAGSFYDPVTLCRDNTPIEPESNPYYYTDAISDNAVKFIEDHNKQSHDDPFFCYVAYTAPHWPLHALEEDIAKYKGLYDEGWDALRDVRRKRMIEMGLVKEEWDMTDRDGRVPAWEDASDKEWQARRMEVYAAQIDRMDQGIGRIVAALKRTGQLENTLILFLADNGGCDEQLGDEHGVLFVPPKTRDGGTIVTGNQPGLMPGPESTYASYGIPWANTSNTPFRLYKHWVHEGGISTPLVVHWPALIKEGGQLCDQPGHVIDVMATAVDVAGAEYPAEYKGNSITPVEGSSLVPAFGDGMVEREAIYWEHEGNRAVRRGKWKLVSRYPGKWELYDIEADRTELNDLSGERPDLAKEMAAMYDSWSQRVPVVDWGLFRKEGEPPEWW
jgi:arylsulfatase